MHRFLGRFPIPNKVLLIPRWGLSLALLVPLVQVSDILLDDYGAQLKKKDPSKLDFLSICLFNAVTVSVSLVSIQQTT